MIEDEHIKGMVPILTYLVGIPTLTFAVQLVTKCECKMSIFFCLSCMGSSFTGQKMLIEAVIPSVHIIIIKFSELSGFKVDVYTYIPTKTLLTCNITVSK
jgi:hypothetical protein